MGISQIRHTTGFTSPGPSVTWPNMRLHTAFFSTSVYPFQFPGMILCLFHSTLFT
jgi:hypothetical protein